MNPNTHKLRAMQTVAKTFPALCIKVFCLLWCIAMVEISSGQTNAADLKSGQKALITFGYHDSWLIMNQKNEIVFLSAHTGALNLYKVDLDDMQFIKSNKRGLLMAEYLAYADYATRYEALSGYTSGAMDSPEFSPNGTLVAYRRYVKDTTAMPNTPLHKLPWTFSLHVVDVHTKADRRVLEEEVSAYTFLTDSSILYQAPVSDSAWLKLLNTHTGEITNYLPISSVAHGITSDDQFIAIHEEKKVTIVDIATKAVVQTVVVPEGMQRVTYLGDQLTLTPREGPASFMKISNGKLSNIVGSYDYEPSVSRSKEYIIVVSEGFGGAVLYKR